MAPNLRPRRNGKVIPTRHLLAAASDTNLPQPLPARGSASPTQHPNQPAPNNQLAPNNQPAPIDRPTHDYQQWLLLLWRRKGILASIILIVALALHHGSISPCFRAIEKVFLIRFHLHIRRLCSWTVERLDNVTIFSPDPPTCIPKLCPSTLSFLRHPDPFDVLNLSPPTDYSQPNRAQIHKGFRRAAAIYHPDRTPIPKDIATGIMAIYTKALAVLSDNEKVADAGLERTRKDEMEPDAKEEKTKTNLVAMAPVDLWAVVEGLRVGDLRYLRFGDEGGSKDLDDQRWLDWFTTGRPSDTQSPGSPTVVAPDESSSIAAPSE